MDCAKLHSAEATRKTPVATRKTRLAPYTSDSLP